MVSIKRIFLFLSLFQLLEVGSSHAAAFEEIYYEDKFEALVLTLEKVKKRFLKLESKNGNLNIARLRAKINDLKAIIVRQKEKQGERKHSSFLFSFVRYITDLEEKLATLTSNTGELSKKESYIIRKKTSKLTEIFRRGIKQNQDIYFDEKKEADLFLKRLFELEEELTLKIFKGNSYKDPMDFFEYNFQCKPLRGILGSLGAVFLLVGLNQIYSALAGNENINENILERKPILNNSTDEKKKKGKDNDLVGPLKGDEERKEKDKKNAKKEAKSKKKDELTQNVCIKKVASVVQGYDGVANCGAHAMFHAEYFLQELETKEKLHPTRKDFIPFWDEYLKWAKTLHSSGISHEKRDIEGDYISSDIIRHFFRNERGNNTKKRVHILEYGKHGTELTLIEQSVKYLSAQETLKELLDDESERSQNIRHFVSEWADLLSGKQTEPIICIISNGGHWIAAEYSYDVEAKKININLRDSCGESKSIAQQPVDVILSLKKKLQEYKDIIDNPSEKILVPKNHTVLSEYLEELKNASDEEKLKDNLIQKMIALFKEARSKGAELLEHKIVFKTKIPSNSEITFSENEFQCTAINYNLCIKDNVMNKSSFTFDINPAAPSEGSKEHKKQNGLPLNEWMEKELLIPLFNFALSQVK